MSITINFKTLEYLMEIINVGISMIVIWIGANLLYQLSMPLQKKVVWLFLGATVFFAIAEMLPLLVLFFPTLEYELFKEVAEMVFISSLAMALHILKQSERFEITYLRQAAVTDKLTGLLNYAHFQREALERFDYAKKHRIPLSLIFMDVDNFKQYNAQFGHAAGNDALEKIAEVLHGLIRTHDLLARYGGEEFALLIHSNLEEAQATAERIRASIEESCRPENDPKIFSPITISVGIAHSTREIKSLREFIELADQQMYCAKTTGKNKVCLPHLP